MWCIGTPTGSETLGATEGLGVEPPPGRNRCGPTLGPGTKRAWSLVFRCSDEAGLTLCHCKSQRSIDPTTGSNRIALEQVSFEMKDTLLLLLPIVLATESQSTWNLASCMQKSDGVFSPNHLIDSNSFCCMLDVHIHWAREICGCEDQSDGKSGLFVGACCLLVVWMLQCRCTALVRSDNKSVSMAEMPSKVHICLTTNNFC